MLNSVRKTFTATVALAILLLYVMPARAGNFPVTVESCGQPLTFDKPPQRAVSHDMNISEIMFALDLQDHMVGVTGITGWYQMTPEFEAARGDIPELASKYPTLENLLNVDPDFFFAGWYYGMRPGEAVTPASLAEFGIKTYVLTESCIHVHDNRPRASMETLYVDVLNIGKIFGVEDKAQALVDDYKARIAAIQAKTRDTEPVRVFLFDNGEEKPFTAGKFAMPTALIEAAGGRNIMDDVGTSWGRVGWESVVERNPEFVIIVGYQDGSWKDRWNFLKNFKPLADTDAIKNDRYMVLGYTEITPGPNNIPAVERLAQALHPDRFE